MTARALVVEDDRNSARALAALVEKEGFSAEVAEDLRAAEAALGERGADVILCDLVLPDGRGTDLLRKLQEDTAATELVLITANATVETAIEALRLGAYDYLTKPVDLPRLRTLLGQVRKTHELREEVSALRGELRQLGRFGPLVGTSAAMQAVYDLIERVAPSDATVLVIGESGTGKELVAETIHRLSRRRSGAFLPLNCGAIQPNLIESELFGHERGSFTGAERQHRGYFERAHQGTLFLDEILEMPVELQVKLLRVLETGRLIRLGGDREIQVDVRVLAATNKNPEAAVKEGRLRDDLYYRLKVFPLQLPPLREREGDPALLAVHFLDELNRAQGTRKRLTREALERLTAYSWPGNVRELRNLLERAFILADEEIEAASLPPEMGGGEAASGPILHLRVATPIAEAERRLIEATLQQLDGDKRRTAEVLGISLKTLYNRLRQYKGQ